eukprot:933543-Prymnesium_polylepis.1
MGRAERHVDTGSSLWAKPEGSSQAGWGGPGADLHHGKARAPHGVVFEQHLVRKQLERRPCQA